MHYSCESAKGISEKFYILLNDQTIMNESYLKTTDAIKEISKKLIVLRVSVYCSRFATIRLSSIYHALKCINKFSLFLNFFH